MRLCRFPIVSTGVFCYLFWFHFNMPIPSLSSVHIYPPFDKPLLLKEFQNYKKHKNWYRQILFLYLNSPILLSYYICFIISSLHTYIWINIYKISFYKLFPCNTLTYLLCNKPILLHNHSTVIKFRKFSIETVIYSSYSFYFSVIPIMPLERSFNSTTGSSLESCIGCYVSNPTCEYAVSWWYHE